MSVNIYNPSTGQLMPAAGVPTQALAAKTNLTVIAPAFDASASYSVGNYVTKDGLLYCCTTAHTGTWDPAHFTSTTVTAISSGGGTIILDDLPTQGSQNGVKSGGVYTALSTKVSATLDPDDSEILVFSTT